MGFNSLQLLLLAFKIKDWFAL